MKTYNILPLFELDFYTEKNETVKQKSYIIPQDMLQDTGTYHVRYEEHKGGVMCVYKVENEDLQRAFYDMEFTNIDFVKKIGLDETFFEDKFSILQIDDVPNYIQQMDRNEKIFLYNFIQKILPQKILEYSCHKGYSTTFISKALISANIKPDFFETHEINPNFAKEAEYTLYNNDIDFVKVKTGDVFDTLDREKLKEADFVFVDSDHSKEFAERYVKEFFPLIKKGCWVGVHDMRFHPNYINGETLMVQKYLTDNNIVEYFYVSDLLKIYKMVTKYTPYEHCGRNTIFFFRR